MIAVSRGGIIDEPALAEALESGHLWGAGIDVNEIEPVPADNAFWDMPNVVMSHHLAGSSWQKERRCVEILVENVRRLQDGARAGQRGGQEGGVLAESALGACSVFRKLGPHDCRWQESTTGSGGDLRQTSGMCLATAIHSHGTQRASTLTPVIEPAGDHAMRPRSNWWKARIRCASRTREAMKSKASTGQRSRLPIAGATWLRPRVTRISLRTSDPRRNRFRRFHWSKAERRTRSASPNLSWRSVAHRTTGKRASSRQLRRCSGKSAPILDMLQCGAASPLDDREFARVTLGLVAPSPLQNCCSGKHAGMLATCLHLGYPVDSYLSPEHPLQVQIREIVADAMELDAASIPLAADGCSVPTFGASITDFAKSFAALAAPAKSPSSRVRSHESAITRLLAAMVRYPENIAGKGQLDTELMRLSNGNVVAKIGAEGLLCLAMPKHELGVAIRICDGSYRGLNILAHFGAGATESGRTG